MSGNCPAGRLAGVIANIRAMTVDEEDMAIPVLEKMCDEADWLAAGNRIRQVTGKR
jgi:hypothetical protein